MRPPEDAASREREEVHLANFRFTSASAADRARGLMFFGDATYGRLWISFVVRVNRFGRPLVTYPAKDDRYGRRRPILRPVDEVAERELEEEVLAALNLRQDTAP